MTLIDYLSNNINNGHIAELLKALDYLISVNSMVTVAGRWSRELNCYI